MNRKLSHAFAKPIACSKKLDDKYCILRQMAQPTRKARPASALKSKQRHPTVKK